jgi:phosphate starvation-inducible protein PhoH and related proteins
MNKKRTKKNESLILNSNVDKFHLNKVSFTEKQKKFYDIASDENTKIMFISGPAGSSKTFISVYSALRMLSSSAELDLIYVRTIIESAEKGLGALPGDLNEKFNPYMIPLIEKLDEVLPRNNTSKKELIESGRVEAMPINFLRGVSWKDKIIIMDEAQNATFKELTTLVTRIGENCKLFICGDLLQSDINGRSGFGDMMDLFDDSESEESGIHCFRFNISDIKRSKILKFIIKKLSNHKNEK